MPESHGELSPETGDTLVRISLRHDTTFFGQIASPPAAHYQSHPCPASRLLKTLGVGLEVIPQGVQNVI